MQTSPSVAFGVGSGPNASLGSVSFVPGGDASKVNARLPLSAHFGHSTYGISCGRILIGGCACINFDLKVSPSL